MMAASPGLFDHSLPHGFHYRENFITEADERVLLDAMATSRSRTSKCVASWRGGASRSSANRRSGGGGAASSVPVAAARHDCAVGWRRCRSVCDGAHQRVSARLAHRLASRRSAIQHRRRSFAVVGMSDETPSVPVSCVATLRPPRRSATHEIVLARRSAYLMTEESRTAYEHHIPPVAELRYSVTFRTLR